jgi:SAM-dependent methyltransferase
MRANLLPFERGAFDSVLLDNVIEHIADPAPLLAEVRRVLREHGWFLVGVPGKKGWDSDPDHKVRYDKDLLIRVVRGAGFMHRETFFMPVGHSDWMDQHIRQYCLYSLFQRDTEYLISSA